MLFFLRLGGAILGAVPFDGTTSRDGGASDSSPPAAKPRALRDRGDHNHRVALYPESKSLITINYYIIYIITNKDYRVAFPPQFGVSKTPPVFQTVSVG